MKLVDAYRANDVKRWQIVKTIRPQSVAEHSWSVAIIAWRLAEEINKNSDCPFGEEVKRADVIEWALVHDMPEIFTGDIATPVKMYIKENAESTIFDRLEKEADQDSSYDIKPLELVARIVKIADIMEAIAFLNENAVGQHAYEVQNRLVNKMWELTEKWSLGASPNVVYEELVKSLPTHIDDLVIKRADA